MAINRESIRMGHCRCVAQSSKAICVIGLEAVKDKSVWIPQSQVHADSEVWKNGQSGELVVTSYWAEKQGWI